MPKRVNNKWVFTDEEIDAQAKKARVRFEEESKNEPIAKHFYFNSNSRILSVLCDKDRSVSFPAANIKELRDASAKDIEAGYITPSGDAIHWDHLDAHYTVAGLVSNIFGTKEWMRHLGKLGGSKTSAAKAHAARLNGLKGGKPKSNPPVHVDPLRTRYATKAAAMKVAASSSKRLPSTPSKPSEKKTSNSYAKRKAR